MSFKTCRTLYGGCGYPFKTKHSKAYLCDECKKKLSKDIQVRLRGRGLM